MLVIKIEGEEVYDEATQTFAEVNEVILELEHSLLSLSKWESKHQKPFLAPGNKSSEELFDYVKCMVVSPNADLDAFDRCSQQTLAEVQAYLDSPQSATTFGQMPERRGPGEVITAELIYYWMVTFNIPFECERWHLNRLFALVRICNIKNSKPKKMGRQEAAQQRAELNAKRRAELNSSG